MSASSEELGYWFDRGVEQKATHMIVVCDSFSWEDYPVYIKENENVQNTARFYDSVGQVMEVYALHLPKEGNVLPQKLRPCSTRLSKELLCQWKPTSFGPNNHA